MKKSKNLSKAAVEIIMDINKMLYNYKINDISNELFRFGCDYLTKHNMYHGYNHFIVKNEKFISEAGSDECYNNGTFLQIYTGSGYILNRSVE